MRFPAAIQSMREGGRIIVHRLYFFDFASGPIRCWDGTGPLTTTKGGITERWDGLGKIVKMEGGAQNAGLFASNMKLTVAFDKDQLSDQIIRAVLLSRSEIYGRRFFCALQFFNSAAQPVDDYKPYYVGEMDRVIYKMTATSKQITLNVEPPLVRKNNSRVTYFSDRDRKRRFPDDDFLARISRLQTKTIKWPKY